MKSPIRPLHNQLVVVANQTETVSAGGLLLPTQAQEAETRGTVLAVGPGLMKTDGTVIPVAVEAGCEILFLKDAGYPITIDDVEYLMLNEEEVFAVIQ